MLTCCIIVTLLAIPAVWVGQEGFRAARLIEYLIAPRHLFSFNLAVIAVVAWTLGWVVATYLVWLGFTQGSWWGFGSLFVPLFALAGFVVMYFVAARANVVGGKP